MSSQCVISSTEGCPSADGLREIAMRYLQDWVAGVSELDPELLSKKANTMGEPIDVGKPMTVERPPAVSPSTDATPMAPTAKAALEASEPTSAWTSGAPALLYGPGASAQEPAAPIPPDAVPLAELTMTRLRATSLMYMEPDIVFHADGVLHHKDMVGVNSYVSSMAAAARSYKLIELRPMVPPGIDLMKSTAFILSHYKLRHIATNNVSHGVQVDCLKFNDSAKITHVWVRRQPTMEEREMFLRSGPAAHPAAVFDETGIVMLGDQGERSADAMAAAAASAGDAGGAAAPSTLETVQRTMERSLSTWLKVWREAPGTAAAVSTGGTESLHPELAEILEPEFESSDIGPLGKNMKADKAYQDIRGIDGARQAIAEMVTRNEMSEWEYAHAVSPSTNIGFSLWQADIQPRRKQSEPYTLQGLDVVVFSPMNGKIVRIYQLRSLTHWEERQVLELKGTEAAY